MSKKRILEKGFALLTVATMIAGITVNVSATAATHNTTTSYNMSGTTVGVVSTITGVTPGEQITYLAYDTTGNVLTTDPLFKDKIVYIDQQAVKSGATCTFSYSAEIDKIGKTVVKFGSQNPYDISPEKEGADQINTYSINVSTVPTDTYTGTVSCNGDKSIVGNGNLLMITPNSDSTIDTITYNGTNIPSYKLIKNTDGNIYFRIDGVSSALNTLAVKFKQKGTVQAPAENTISQGLSFANDLNNVVPAKKTIATYSTATVTEATDEVYEYGIFFSYACLKSATINVIPNTTENGAAWFGNNVISTGTGATLIAKYKALGKGIDGRYAVKLIDGGSGYLTGQAGYFTTPYIIVKKGVTGSETYQILTGDSIEFN